MDFGTLFIGAGMLIGGLSFAAYRFIDLAQIFTIRSAKRPEDLEKLSEEVYLQKRGRKVWRTWKTFFKSSFSWSLQAGYVVGGIPLLVIVLANQGLGNGVIYTILMVLNYVVNLFLSKMFSLWTPSLPFIKMANHKHVPGCAHNQPALRPANLAWQAWGLAAWAVPTYFLVEAYGAHGWMGSVFFMTISQILQLVGFIYTLKKRAIPYQKYPGLSDTFKANLQAYLKTQGIQDHEVGVIEGMKVGPNAFATSMTGWYRQIVLTEELVKGFTDPQNPEFTMKLGDDTLESVIAHEVGHVKYHHVEKSVFAGLLVSALTTVAVYYIFTNPGIKPDEFFFDTNTSQQILLFWGQAFFNVALTFPLTFFMIGRIRGNEFQADTHLLATNGCKHGQDFFHQIRHIAPTPNHPWWERCNMTHPDPKDREERMKRWADEHCQGSEAP